MFENGYKFRLVLPIIGKKKQFDDGLIGEITEVFERENGRAYQVQFTDGRMALLPEYILAQSSEPL